MPEEHALLSCSSSKMWLSCPPSLRLNLEFEKQDTKYTKSGTFMHSLAEYKIRMALGEKMDRPVSPEFDNEEADALTDDYADYVLTRYKKAKAKDKNAKIYLERKVSLSSYAPQCFGTADVIITYKTEKVYHVVIIDYKSGFIEISAADETGKNPGNTQLCLYSLGAIEEFFPDEKNIRVEMTIVQPRLENLSIVNTTARELRAWGRKVVKPNALLAFKGEGEFCPGEHCKYCMSAVKCRARAEAALKIAKSDFKRPDLITDEEIAEVIKVIPEAQKWFKDVMDYSVEQAKEGKVYPGLKLVVSKSGSRSIIKDKVDVVTEILSRKYDDDFFSKRVLLGVPELQKKLKDDFEPLIGEYIIKSEDSLTLANVDDKRKEVIIANTEFTNIKGEII